MKQLIFLSALLPVMCCARPLPRTPPPPRDLVSEALAETVTLFSGGRVCAGVWVGEHWVLTANHCTVVEEQAQDSVECAPTEEDEPAISIVGFRDSTHDLALVYVSKVGPHPVAAVATHNPTAGEALHVVGHPMGLFYTFMRGYMAQVRPTLPRFDRSGPFLQIQVPIAPGNSGGGAFNERGELVGIADFISEQVPDEGFFVSHVSIREFMTKSSI